MANGAKVALAVGAGYFLGRTRKMRIALMLAAAGVTGKFPPTPGSLMSQGLKSLGATEQLHDLSEQLRGEVLTAAKAATLAAATNRVDALSNRLQGVVPTEDVGRAAGSASRGLTSVAGRTGPASDGVVDDDYGYGDEEPMDVDEADLDEDDYDEAVDEGDLEDDDVEDQDVDDEEIEAEVIDDEVAEETPPRRRASRRASTPRASVRRSRATTADHNGEPPKAPSRRARASTAQKRAPVRRGR
ncbi:hypothetical protein ABGB19_17230 [Mycobacterium sp. B14F4]|uniref:hypothetical protein n=1 Tax=Mycobacterium sp. B14F4 TaxID=3153565 RepID=UPI00325EB6DF